ncbi:MAG: hypothetical protein RBS11_10070 [Sulfurimonas sp.]|nr:hypothetical protein [Sulfurimonas sp.]
MTFSEAMLQLRTLVFKISVQVINPIYEVKTSLPKEMCGFEVRKVFGSDAFRNANQWHSPR